MDKKSPTIGNRRNRLFNGGSLLLSVAREILLAEWFSMRRAMVFLAGLTMSAGVLAEGLDTSISGQTFNIGYQAQVGEILAGAADVA